MISDYQEGTNAHDEEELTTTRGAAKRRWAEEELRVASAWLPICELCGERGYLYSHHGYRACEDCCENLME